jgi:3-isopropylmalate/(R)-2-methylmalate dehydratase large subunit
LDIFKKEFGARVWDREKLVVIPDHYIFTSDDRANRNVDILRDFCAEQNVKYFYDIKDLRQRFRSYKGVCHCRPGEVPCRVFQLQLACDWTYWVALINLLQFLLGSLGH